MTNLSAETLLFLPSVFFHPSSVLTQLWPGDLQSCPRKGIVAGWKINDNEKKNFSLIKKNPSFLNLTSSKRVCGLMLPLRSSVYILKSEPGNERSSAHFPTSPQHVALFIKLSVAEARAGKSGGQAPRGEAGPRGHLARLRLPRRPLWEDIFQKSHTFWDNYVTLSAANRASNWHLFKYLSGFLNIVRLVKVFLWRAHHVQIMTLPNYHTKSAIIKRYLFNS